MSDLSPFDKAMENALRGARQAPPGAIDAASEAYEALRLAKAAVVELYGATASPEHAIAVMQAMLQQAVARSG